jgi:fatty acid desaturase
VAVVAVRVEHLERGNLPRVCAKTGVACDVLVKDRLRVVPRWVPPLAVLLIVPYFVARAYSSRNIEVQLPISAARQERIRLLVRAAWVALVLAAAGLAAALFRAGVVGVLALLVGLLGYVVIVYLGDQMWVGARPGPAPDVVVLTRVHPEFVRALDYWDASASE